MSFLKTLVKKIKKEELREIEEQPIEKDFTIFDKEIRKNNVVVFLIPSKIYQDGVLHVTKTIANRFSKILYICLNNPAERLIDTLNQKNIDAEKFLFIDAVTKKVKTNISGHNTSYISSPKNFEKFKNELNQIIEKEKLECIIFDSLSTMLIYQDDITVIRFAYDLITKIKVARGSGQFICLEEDIDSALVNGIAMFADKVVGIDKKETKKEVVKKEKIRKLEKELKSLEKGCKSKFISKESYRKGKERIEKRLKILRK